MRIEDEPTGGFHVALLAMAIFAAGAVLGWAAHSLSHQWF
jgi:hypothetical protein